MTENVKCAVSDMSGSFFERIAFKSLRNILGEKSHDGNNKIYVILVELVRQK